MGDPYIYFLASLLGQPVRYDIAVLDLTWEHDFPGNKGRACVILFQKSLQDLFFRILCGNGNMKMLSADQFASPDKEHLHYSVLLVHGKSHYISVFTIGACDLLLLGHSPDTV